jgi:hypothetical protein
MMATLGPWLRRVFAPVFNTGKGTPNDAPPDDDLTQSEGDDMPDPITRELDAAMSEHKRIFLQERDMREARLKRLAATIDDCLARNTFGSVPRQGKAHGDG